MIVKRGGNYGVGTYYLRMRTPLKICRSSRSLSEDSFLETQNATQ